MIPIIDAGHGGMINGVYQTTPKKMYTFEDGLTIHEGVINRAIGRKVLALLDNEEMPVYNLNCYCETDDPLRERSATVNHICKENPSSYLISIHSNAASSSNTGKGTTANGFEICIYEKASMKSLAIAEIAKEEYRKSFPGIKFRGIKKKNLHMLRETKCPAILVENLFFDNRKEAEYLLADTCQWYIAKCIFEIIQKVYKL